MGCEFKLEGKKEYDHWQKSPCQGGKESQGHVFGIGEFVANVRETEFWFEIEKFSKTGDQITVSCDLKNNLAEICVRDTGKGIKEEMQQKMFRLDANISTRGTSGEEGTGLGLILSKEFIEKQGGKIWIESKEGEGTAVFFTLPVVKN